MLRRGWNRGNENRRYHGLFAQPDPRPRARDQNFADLLERCQTAREYAVHKIRQCVNEVPDGDNPDYFNGRGFFNFYHPLKQEELKQSGGETHGTALTFELAILVHGENGIQQEIDTIQDAVGNLSIDNALATLFIQDEDGQPQALLRHHLNQILEKLEAWKNALEQKDQWPENHQHWYNANRAKLNEVQNFVFISQERALMQGLIVARLSQIPRIDVTYDFRIPMEAPFISPFERALFDARKQAILDETNQSLEVLRENYLQLKQMVYDSSVRVDCLVIATATLLGIPLIVMASIVTDPGESAAFFAAGLVVLAYIMCRCVSAERRLMEICIRQDPELSNAIEESLDALFTRADNLVNGDNRPMQQPAGAVAVDIDDAPNGEQEGHVARLG